MKKIYRLDALRGIACIIVLVAHWISTSTSYGIYAAGCGKIGVWCFMIMSGFFLMLPYVDGVLNFSLRNYYIKKIFRIYPAYIVALILAALIGFITPDRILLHIFALEGVGHFWYMPVILKLYLVYPLIVLLNKWVTNRKVFVGILSALAIGFAFIFPYQNYIENAICLYWYVPVFIAGMLLAFVYVRYKDGKKLVLGDIVVVVAMLGIWAFTPLSREVLLNCEPSAYLQNKYLLIGFFWIIIIIGILFGKYIGLWLDKCKLLQWVGKISFPLYLFHYLILWKINAYLSNMLAKGLVLIVLSVVFAWLVNRFIEEPLNKWVRYSKWLKKSEDF